MDPVSAIATLSVSMSQQSLSQDVGVAVLRKVRDTQAAAAATLIEKMLPPPVLPDHLGQNVNRRV